MNGFARYFNGWSLFWLLSAGVAVAAFQGPIVENFSTESLRWALRVTARTSAVLFLLAMTASAAARLAPSAFTHWQRNNRRMLGLAFAFSHFVHAGFIIAFSAQGPEQYAEAITPVMVVAGAIGYTFIILMAATSFAPAARWIGPVAWRRLHTSGIYWLWLQFVIAFGKRAAAGPLYWAVLALFALALGMRILAWFKRAPREKLNAV